MPGRVIAGTALHTPTRGSFEALEGVLILVDPAGRIAEILPGDHPHFAAVKAQAERQGNLTELQNGQFLLPGLVDLHIHASQWPQLGKALDAPLEVWLQKYTFPLEARYSDLSFAREVYSALVETLLANGTTTGLCRNPFFPLAGLWPELARGDEADVQGQAI